jgi:hypothetical protein
MDIRTCHIPYFQNDIPLSHLAEIKCYSWYNVFTPLEWERSNEQDGLALEGKCVPVPIQLHSQMKSFRTPKSEGRQDAKLLQCTDL